MSLEVRDRCERRAVPSGHCSYECTFCLVCAGDMKFVCADCEGELVSRPRRST